MTEVDEWRADELEEVRVCPICGGGRLEPFDGRTRDRTLPTGPARWTHLRCFNCRAALLSPRPRPEALGKAYRTYYTHREPVADDRSEAERASLAWRILDGYLEVRYGYQAEVSLGRLGWLVARCARGPRATADRFVRNLSCPPPGSEARLLDVGCGNGEFLVRMRARGWSVWGVEPDEVAAATGRAAGLEIHVGEVPDAPITGAPFDAITLSHVIEHVADPVELLRRCRALLRPGGTIWLLTPNADAPGRARYGSDWVSWDAPRHLVIYTRPALERVLVTAGFRAPRWLLPLVNARSWIYPVCENVRRGGAGESIETLGPDAARAARLCDLRVMLGAGDRAEEIVVMADAG